MSDIDTNRLRNWAKAYQRLMEGGLSVEAHTACVDDFAADDGEFPYITADDVLELLDRLAAAEGAVARVRALHHRRSWQPGDFVYFGQADFPDICDYCHDQWPCGTTHALDGKPAYIPPSLERATATDIEELS